MNKLTKMLFAFALIAILSGCGGGGSNNNDKNNSTNSKNNKVLPYKTKIVSLDASDKKININNRYMFRCILLACG